MSKSKTHIGQDVNYENMYPVTLASVIAAKNVRDETEVQESNFPTCLICGNKGHNAIDCRRWLDPEPDPEPPGTVRSSVFYEPSIERSETPLAVFSLREHRRRNQAEPGPYLLELRTKVLSRKRDIFTGSDRGNAKPLCKGEISLKDKISDPTPQV